MTLGGLSGARATASLAKTVIIGIGVPGAGKTTYLKRHAAKIGATYISLDDLRAELLGQAGDHSQNDLVWKEAYIRVDAAVARGRDVVVDGAGVNPNYRRSDIKRYQRKAGAERVVGYWFQVPLQVALARNRGRAVEVPEAIIRRWYKLLLQQPPSLADGFSELVTIDTTEPYS